MTLRRDFGFGDEVVIDGSDVHGVVTGVIFRPGASSEMMADSYVQYEVSWFALGQAQTAWFDGFRLTLREVS